MSMSKRIRCKYYAQGACFKGENCSFLHETKAPSRNVCSYYQKGTCTYGSRCRYEHVKPTRSWHIASSSAASFQSKDAVSAPRNSFSGDLSYEIFRDSSSIPCKLWHGASSSSAALQTKVSGSLPLPLSPKISLDSKYERPGNGSICSLAAEGNCPQGENCPLIHGDRCSTCGKHCLHPHKPQDREEHVKACEKKQKHIEALKISEEIECSVCFDRVLSKPTAAERKFGILSECDHPFCVTCIRNWRRSSQASGMDVNSASRSCPICRKLSYFVIPSETWYTTKEEKESIINNYKARLKLIDCKHFNFGDGNCPFGTSCFYKHTVKPGSYTWVHHRPPPSRRSNRLNVSSMLDAFEQIWSMDELIGVGPEDDYEEDMEHFYDLDYLIDPGDYGFDSNDMSPMDMAILLRRLGLESSDISSDDD